MSIAGIRTTTGHEVDEDLSGAHAHDHTHGRKASWRRAAHEHPHLHKGDSAADGLLNGHVHAVARPGLPWEATDPA